MGRSDHLTAAALASLFQSGAETTTLAALAQTCRHLRDAARHHAADLSHGQERHAVRCVGAADFVTQYPGAFVYTAGYTETCVLSDVLGCSCTGR